MAQYKPSFTSDWDVEQYRHHWDSSDQWELRKQFMLAHKESIPEVRLVCLAQVFANMEFLQCKYPKEVMEEVKALAGNINSSYQETKQQRQSILFKPETRKSPSTSQRCNERQSESQERVATKHECMEAYSDKSMPSSRPSAKSWADNYNYTSSSSSTCTPVNSYQMQSYYTSSYKLQQRQAAASNATNSQGPGDNTL